MRTRVLTNPSNNTTVCPCSISVIFMSKCGFNVCSSSNQVYHTNTNNVSHMKQWCFKVSLISQYLIIKLCELALYLSYSCQNADSMISNESYNLCDMWHLTILRKISNFYSNTRFFWSPESGISINFPTMLTFCPETRNCQYPDSKVHRADMEPIWGRQDPGGPHVDLMNFVIWLHLYIGYGFGLNVRWIGMDYVLPFS